MFHSRVAEEFGLSIADWRTWDLIIRDGPLTAGDLARVTGLTPGAVTGLIDRLERAGAVRRVGDSADRRKTLVRAREQSSHEQLAKSIFSPMLRAAEELYATYSDDQLRAIADFMTRMAALLREQTSGLERPRKFRPKAAGD
jgi:DNA-binding MarR family transcriptional regulator